MIKISAPQQRPSQSEFQEQLLRIRQITGASTQAEMAEFFNTTLYAVKTACRKRKIPAEWIVFLVMWRGVNPEWILRGIGDCCLVQIRLGGYETGEDAAVRWQKLEAFAKISSQGLADELLRRLAAADVNIC